jgi:predicted alpha/beta superfamily hydrolase
MKRIAAVSILLFFLLLPVNIHAQNPAGTPPEVSIAGTQLLSINSSVTDKKYDLYINLPANYGDTTKVYPVVFLLDAQWDFTLMQSIYGQQYFDGFIPEMVIVGITWGGNTPNYDSLRRGDFTPLPEHETTWGGNAPKFLQFIKTELIPFIESKYRVRSDDRTLIGTSLGGLFTLYTMFHETNLFNRYLVTSPAVPWADEVTFKYEKEFAAANTKLPVRLFIGIGEYEDPAVLNKFESVLKSRNYTGLNLKTRVLEEVGHSGTKPLGYSWGLQYVFARPELNIDSSELKQYEGLYRVYHYGGLKIFVENNHLMLQDMDGSKRMLYAETKNDFYAKGVKLVIHFKKDDSGNITGFQIEVYGRSGFAQVVTH